MPDLAGPIASKFRLIYSVERGMNNLKVDPLPSSLCTRMLPPQASIMREEVASPSPVPTPISLVVKNGLKRFLKFSSEIPQPLSSTEMHQSGAAISA